MVQGGVPKQAKPGKLPKADMYADDALHEHLRIFSEAIVLQMKLLVDARDLAALIDTAGTIETTFWDCACALDHIDGQSKLIKAVSTNCTSMASQLDKLAVPKGEATFESAVAASLALRAAAITIDCDTPGKIGARVSDTCQKVVAAYSSGSISVFTDRFR